MKHILKRVFSLMIMMAALLPVSAQGISVSSFQMLENDLTANTHGTMMNDFNGQPAALIKVVTTAQGFAFDGGMTGIVKVQQKIGEIWVYVPHGIKRMTIQHQQLGTLRDYYFPIPIEKARTYEMVLSAGQVQTVTNVSVTKQFVVFNIEPANAMLEFDNEILTVDESGMAAKSVPFGKYQYRVSCENYHTEAGVIEVNAESKANIQVSLKPNFGWIDLTAASEDYNGAHIYLNNHRIGQLPMRTEPLKSGDYQLRIVKQMYKSFEQQVKVSDNQTTPLVVSLQPNFAQVTFEVSPQTEIWIDEQQKGVGESVVRLEPGEYKVETRRASHQSNSQLIQIGGLEDQRIVLRDPVPLYGSVEVMTSPLGVKVYMDGDEVGETPLMLGEVLIGKHDLLFEKASYQPLTKQIEVAHNETAKMNVNLQKRGTSSAASPSASQTTKHETAQSDIQSDAQADAQADAKKSLREAKRQARRRVPKNEYFRNMALYTGVALRPNLSPTNGDLGYLALHAGATIKSVNLDCNWAFDPEDFVYQKYDARLGYSLKAGRVFMFTPQVGYEASAGFSPIDGEYKKLQEGLVLACRAQLCAAKGFALEVTPSYSLADKHLDLQFGFVFNFSLVKIK